MTYSSFQTYEFTAFQIGDLRPAGEIQLDCGETFTMPSEASVCISVCDNDSKLSGDQFVNENAADITGQTATIEGPGGTHLGNGGQIYAESYFWVKDQNNCWYLVIEIEQEGSSEKFYTFHEAYGLPPAGSVLTVCVQENVTSDWIDFTCLDAGEKPVEPGSVSGRLFNDADHDNTEWNNETNQWEDGIADATVKLLDANGDVVATTTTDQYGNYKFENVAPGDYKVKFYNPDGTEFVQKDVGYYGIDSDANANGVTDGFTIVAGQNLCNVDAGVKVATGSISGTVFCDTDCDGLQEGTVVVQGHTYTIEAEDMYAAGFKTVHGNQASGGELVKLTQPEGTGVLCTVFNGKDGTYSFSIFAQDENDGCSVIQVKINGQLVDTITLHLQTDGSGDDNGGFTKFTIDDLQLKTGDVIELCVVGNNYEAARIDKIELVGEETVEIVEEPVKEGVVIKLLDANGVVIDTTETDADGNYSFDDVPVGSYKIMGVAPDGTEFTIKDAGTNDSIDSDVDSTGTSDLIQVTAGSNTDIDLGVCEKETGSLSGRYFLDANRDGLDNDPGNGIAGIVVELLDENGAGTGVTTTTLADGSYSFTDLDAGTYGVKFTDPDTGRTLTTPNAGDDAIDSDATDVGGGMSVITGIAVAAGVETPDNDAGVVIKTGTISGRYFVDEDGNNRDDGEPGIGGATVSLVQAGVVVATVPTNDDGTYTFTDVEPGEYSVVFEAPGGDDAGKVFVTPDQGDDLDDSDVVAVAGDGSGSTASFVLVAGEDKGNVDAGVADPGTAAIGDTVFLDANKDGLLNNGEGGIDGVEVTLLADLDNDGEIDDVVEVTTTANGGQYLFDGLNAGDYRVQFGTTGGLVYTTPGAAADDAVDGDSDAGANGVTETITLDIGEVETDIDAGLTDPGTAAIGDTVFLDANKDGLLNNGEGGIDGVEVTLLADLDNDGEIDDVVEVTTTTNGGQYLFDGLDAGDYRVQFGTTGGLVYTTPSAAADDAVDGDSDAGANGVTETITLDIGEVETDIDAGLTDPGTAAIGDTVFLDANKDGLLNNGEGGIDGVEVTLLADLDNDGEIDDVVEVTTTTNGGQYLFDGLDAGDYRVQFGTTGGLVYTTPGAAADDAVDGDSDAGANGVTETITLDIGEVETDIDAGLTDPGTAAIGDTVFLDANKDGLLNNGEGGIDGVEVTLLADLDNDGEIDDVVEVTTTTNGGQYLFDGLDAGDYRVQFGTTGGLVYTTPGAAADDAVDGDSDAGANGVTETITLDIGEVETDIDAGLTDPGTAAIGDTVFLDANKDGLLNNGEGGIDGVEVTLLADLDNDGEIDDVVEVTTTTNGGQYLFDGLDAGDYRVQFGTTGGLVYTTPSAAADDAVDGDSDAGANGVTETITLDIGEVETDIDAGLTDPGTAAIGDTVFLDANKDGLLNNGEGGIDGVEVTLLADLDNDGEIDDVVEVTTTTNGGQYLFDGLDAGDYRVQFGTTGGLVYTTPGAAADDAVDGDSDAGANGVTETITLDIGEVETDIDAGLTDPGTAQIGNFVWFDANEDGQFDAGELAAAGVSVTLLSDLDNDGDVDDVVEIVTTQADGSYKFDNLNAGLYAVVFGTVAGFGYTVPTFVNAEVNDNDSDAGIGGITNVFGLSVGEIQNNIDAGLVKVNEAPEPNPDTGMGCADEDIVVDVLANDNDDGGQGSLTVLKVGGVIVDQGEASSVEINGVSVYLNAAGEVVFNGEAKYGYLDIGEKETETFTYTVVDAEGLESESTVTITFCGDANTVQSFCESLPDGEITYQIQKSNIELPVEEYAFDLKFVTTGDERFDGEIFVEAYCLDRGTRVASAESFADAPINTATMYCIDDARTANLVGMDEISVFNNQTAFENLDLVTWILNQDFENNGYTGWEVQRAIWELVESDDLGFLDAIDPGFGLDSNVQDILQAASMFEGFQAGTDGVIAVIVDPGTSDASNLQPFIVGMDFETFDCLC